MANKYDVKSDVLFQFLPDWVMDTNDSEWNMVNNDVDDLLDNMGDLIADLSVEVIRRSNNYFLGVVYSDKYSSGFIDRFVQSYKFVLNDMLRVNTLRDISYVSSDDLVLLEEFNDTGHHLLYADVLDAFNDNLVKYPDNVLVSYMGSSYSYAEGAYIANMLAQILVDLGVVSGDCIGFLVPRSELYMFCVLGVLSCGGVFVPLDEDLPDERLSFILDDSGCKVVIVSDVTFNRVDDLSDSIILNISDIMREDIGCLDCLPVIYGDLACILYTSGTTGVPKGVKISRSAVLNLSAYYVDTYNLFNSSVYGLYSSIVFDAGPQGIFQSIYAGACLSIIPKDVCLDISNLNKYIIEQGITHIFIPTQVGRLFIESVQDTTLEILSVGGEKLDEIDNSRSYMIVDEFGPTEAFAFISSIDVFDKLHTSSVGFVNFNVKVYVLDDELRRVPLGAVGELYVSGCQLANGYLNRDEETSHTFVGNPFDGGDYGVLYRTGDMCRFLPDGSLGIVGRRDGQVKVRGNRVELSEVEAVIREVDFVENVTVQTVKNGSNNELVAYVVSNNDDIDGIVEDIRAYVASRKPDYMVPSFV
ncbi:amino acid adenylation domain-containing protein, partial [Methanobrevibacter sp.]